jgi:hypothetical protein
MPYAMTGEKDTRDTPHVSLILHYRARRQRPGCAGPAISEIDAHDQGPMAAWLLTAIWVRDMELVAMSIAYRVTVGAVMTMLRPQM